MKMQKKPNMLKKDTVLPLWRLIWNNSTTMLVLTLVVLVILLALILGFGGQRLWEYLALLPIFGVFFFVLLVLLPNAKSVSRVRRQERALGVRYGGNGVDGQDGKRPDDWFYAGVGAEFVLLHRRYIKKVIQINVIKPDGDLDGCPFYQVVFEDCEGKKRKFRLEHLKGERDRFNHWYTSNGAQTVDTEEDEDDIYLETDEEGI